MRLGPYSALAAALAGACALPPDPGGPWFEDVTERAGLAFDRAPADRYLSVPARMGGGVCVIDADGQPPLDLFFALPPSAASGGSRLFVGRGAWDYADETEARGLSDLGYALGCLVFDADGDGDDDLFVTGVGQVRWLVQEQGGVFVDRSDAIAVEIPPHDMLSGASAADYDGDGDLDVAIGGFIDLRSAPPEVCDGVPCSFYLAGAVPVRSYLLRRTESGYADATAELAPALMQPEPTLVLGSSDVDGDGIIDLYVGNDLGARFMDRVLVRGPDGVLRDATDRLGLAHDAGGHGVDTMGWTTGDIDGDGDFDHATTAFAGFHSPIFVCDQGVCEDRGRARGASAVATSFRWGNALADLDRDGDLDLFEATGHLATEEEGRRLGLALEHAQRPNLLANAGDGTFALVVPAEGDALGRRWPARGISVADLDDDGALDVVLATTFGAPALLRNVRAAEGHFLRVRLAGRPPNAGGVGALVRVHAPDGARVRQRLAGEGFLGSFDPRLHFGLPLDGRVDVEVRWPSGRVSWLRDVEIDREIVVSEP